jgi:myo-inositol 2-dehydrogenase / D-chiro-inositol 1-dehydrogenase
MVANPRCQLESIYDVNTQAAEELAATVGAKVASPPDQIWNSNVDAVMIASSTSIHAGKPAYLEKPIDLDIERVKRVVQISADHPTPILVGFSRRFDGNHLGARQAVHSGRLANSRCCFNGT